jgi:hypothetical protein
MASRKKTNETMNDSVLQHHPVARTDTDIYILYVGTPSSHQTLKVRADQIVGFLVKGDHPERVYLKGGHSIDLTPSVRNHIDAAQHNFEVMQRWESGD